MGMTGWRGIVDRSAAGVNATCGPPGRLGLGRDLGVRACRRSARRPKPIRLNLLMVQELASVFRVVRPGRRRPRPPGRAEGRVSVRALWSYPRTAGGDPRDRSPEGCAPNEANYLSQDQ